jgi:PPOX class probable F420-dependent enzyme
MPAIPALQSDHVQQRLRSEPIIWLTTVNSAGQPQSSPVWFYWDGESFLLYSERNQKVHNISAQQRVSLHLNDNGTGGDIVTIEGDATVDSGAPPADQHTLYLEKYRAGISRIGMDPTGFAAKYDQPVRITPTAARVW